MSIARLNHTLLHHVSAEWAVGVDAGTDMLAVFKTLLQAFAPLGNNADEDARRAEAQRAAVNEADAYGNTALHLAMAYKLPNSTAALLALGARTDVANHAEQVSGSRQLKIGELLSIY